MAFREAARANLPELAVQRPRTAAPLAFWPPVQEPPRPLAVSPRDHGVFPPDAVAHIFPPARSAMTAGRARMNYWMLRFERRTPPFIEALMGWTGGDDMLQQVELKFPDLQSAVAYAERQGLAYRVAPAAPHTPVIQSQWNQCRPWPPTPA